MPYAGVVPRYFLRTQIKSKLDSIREEDDFLSRCDLATIDGDGLRGIVSRRCCGRVGDDEVMKSGIRDWLNGVELFKKKVKGDESEAKLFLGMAGLYASNAMKLVKGGGDDIEGTKLARRLFAE